MVEVGVRVAPEQLRRISAELRRQADRELTRELNRGLQRATRPMREAAKVAMLAKLPRRGGLNVRAAAARQTLRRRNVRVPQITIEARSGRQRVDMRAINAGLIRHPVFGNRKRWVFQRIPALVVFDAYESKEQEARHELELALEDVARKIDGAARKG